MATLTLTLSRLQRPAGTRAIPSTRGGNVTWIAFVLAQVSDGALTYVGISTFGPSIEANPLLAWLIAATGLGSATARAKECALGCAPPPRAAPPSTRAHRCLRRRCRGAVDRGALPRPSLAESSRSFARLTTVLLAAEFWRPPGAKLLIRRGDRNGQVLARRNRS